MAVYLKTADGTLITRFVSLSQSQTRTLTVQAALDGTEYLTMFGDPITDYNLTLQVNTAGRTLLLSAANNLTLLEVNVKAGTFYGRIKELGEFERMTSEWFSTTAVLSSVSEVTDR